MRAGDLTEGTVVLIRDREWTVTSNVPVGTLTRLQVASPVGGTFTKAIDPDTEFTAVVVTEDVADGWSAEATRAMDAIGATFLYWEDAEGVYHLPLMTDATIAAHLLAFHGVTWEGVSLAEARLAGSTMKGVDKRGRGGWADPVAERTMTIPQATALADFSAMHALHDRLHTEPLLTNHRHDVNLETETDDE